MSKEKKTIAKSQWHELKYAAKSLSEKLGVEVKEWEVLKGIQELKNNRRDFIYAAIISLKK